MHLSLEAIIDLLEGRSLSCSEEGRSDDKHVEQCPECRGRVEEWQLLYSRLHGTQLTDAPARVLKAAYGIVEPRAGIGQILASLIFDSFTQPAFAGARGAGAPRQLVLRASEFDVHIRISGMPESRQITGQIMARKEKGFVDLARVHLLKNGEPVRSADLDSLGELVRKFARWLVESAD